MNLCWLPTTEGKSEIAKGDNNNIEQCNTGGSHMLESVLLESSSLPDERERGNPCPDC